MAIDWSGHLSPLERAKAQADRAMCRQESSRYCIDVALASLKRKADAIARRKAFTVIRGGAERPEGYLSTQKL